MRSGIHLLLLISCALTASARDEVKRDFGKTAALPAGRALRIEHQFGRIRVRTHARNEVQINAVIRCSAPTAAEADRHIGEVQIAVEESVSGVYVRTRYPSNWPRNVSYNADYEILMPAAAPLDVRNRFGEIDISGLNASATINSGNGPVTLIGGRGRQRIDNSFGTVEVRNIEGDVAIGNGNGRVTAADITGAVDITNRFETTRVLHAGRGVTVRSQNGQVEVENAGGPVAISNSFNRVSVTDAKADVHVQNQNGDVVANGVAGAADLHTSFATITFARIGKGVVAQAQNTQIRGDTVGESATIETTFGGVDVRGVKGAARVTTGNTPVKLSGIGGEVYVKASFASVAVADAAGPVTVEGQNSSVLVDARAARGCQPLALRTSFGTMRVTIPRGAGYNLAARTSFGRIHTDGVQVTVGGDISPNSLTGKIGAGGCELRLNNQNGGIDIVGQ
jgi:hypothetical protein